MSALCQKQTFTNIRLVSSTFFSVTQAPRTLIGIPGAIFGMSYTMYKMIGLTLVKINHGA